MIAQQKEQKYFWIHYMKKQELLSMNNDNHDSSLGVDNEDNKEIMLKEIDLIQSCINRMSQNSFIIKGWAISLNGIIVALFADKGHPIITQIICIVSILCFWYLDAFFLLAEKRPFSYICR
jgi:hypothetical protein